MANAAQPRHVFWEGKISIEPDLGDQRLSTYKALPSPPKTPKRVMMKYRFSGVFPLILSLATFVLSLVLVLAGQEVGKFEGQYLVALNTSRLGQDVVTFEKADATSAAPSATSSSPLDLLDPLNPLSTNSPLNPASSDNPLNQLGQSLGSLANNLTDAIDDGLTDVIDEVVEGVVKQTGIRDVYRVYLQKLCFGTIGSGDSGSTDDIRIEDCRSYEEAGKSISVLSKNIHSSIIIGQTRVSVPLLAKLVSSLGSILNSLNGVRKAIFASLVISTTGSILSVVSVVPAMCFPRSRLLIYINMFWPGFAGVFALLAAGLLSIIIVLARVVAGFSETVGVQIRAGGMVLLFAWLSFVFMSLITFYWASVWFVEARKWSFVRRCRDEDEVGHWRGIMEEIWRDLQGQRRMPNVRADM